MPEGNNVSTTALVLIAVVPAVATGTLAFLTGLLAERRQQQAAHDTWLRQRRYDAYGELLAAMTSFGGHVATPTTNKQVAAAFRMTEARARALLLSDQAAVAAIIQRTDQLGQHFRPAQAHLEKEAPGMIVSHLRNELSSYITLTS